MTTEPTGTPRANQKGDPCPPWCTQDHSRPIVPGKPQYGPSDGHWSDLSAHDGRLIVRLAQLTGYDTGPKICLSTIYGQYPVFIAAAEAGSMAALLDEIGAGKLAGLLRAAAALTEEGR